jgi:5-formyltetrahydrofolate cyclo-ligase
MDNAPLVAGAVTAEKRALRQMLRKRREAVLDREGRSGAIARALLTWEPCKEASRLLIYVGVGTEVDTALLRAEKPCAMPVVVGDELEFRLPPLVPGYRGIPEPTGEAIVPGAGDLLVVPVLGFDSEMNRLGQGKAYYDKYIARMRREHPEVLVVGLAFLLQQVDRLTTEPHDERMDAIATEAGVWEY